MSRYTGSSWKLSSFRHFFFRNKENRSSSTYLVNTDQTAVKKLSEVWSTITRKTKTTNLILIMLERQCIYFKKKLAKIKEGKHGENYGSS